jgi:CDP-glucose 4,6-dehydratase
MRRPDLAELGRTFAGKRVLLTGHTGFKGSWLTLWLAELGAEVTGYALPPETRPALHQVIGAERLCRSVLADVRDADRLRDAVRQARPDFVFHLAAQSLVRVSYQRPVETVATNVLGTAHLLDALRLEGRPCAVVVVTSDKCYENRERATGYHEDEPMGGHDVYSASKGAAELVVASFRRSFFPPARLAEHGVALATARAGNVVGGGDWASHRLVPDAVGALAQGQPIPVRNPDSVRPWQHVVEPLGAYLLLASRLAGAGPGHPADFCEAWNFGPLDRDVRTVRELVEALIAAWGHGSWEDHRDPAAPHEAALLRLSTEKARDRLAWAPRWGFEETVRRTAAWYRAHQSGEAGPVLADRCRAELRAYLES